MKEKLQNLWFRIAYNPKTTIGGVSITAVIATVAHEAIKQAHCDFNAIQWGGIVSVVLMPALMGAFSTDANKTIPQ